MDFQAEFAVGDRRSFGSALGEIVGFGADHWKSAVGSGDAVMLIGEDRLEPRVRRAGDSIAQRNNRQLGHLGRIDDLDAVVVDIDSRLSVAGAPVAMNERVG